MTHKIYITNKIADRAARLDPHLIRRVIKAALAAEDVEVPCEVSVLICGDFEIQAVNKEFRGIDAPTDVLSFPVFEFKAGGFDVNDGEIDIETGLLPIGDIVLNAAQLDKQAADFGQTRERETAYLVIHSVLHLLGYDHTDEGAQKRQMREREKEILKELGYTDD
ncbi:MAG: rRNA maturation RNase YbeY [Oscillospiraceae bacterium]|jgi:probable rRNA maturation factor|nr:rRNA maturation RNase YbeY [Oscillospiraceae bacterium]